MKSETSAKNGEGQRGRERRRNARDKGEERRGAYGFYILKRSDGLREAYRGGGGGTAEFEEKGRTVGEGVPLNVRKARRTERRRSHRPAQRRRPACVVGRARYN